jgi:Plasma-membrane choline transporter
MEASRCVMQLFADRGWTAIIADTMVDTVLFMLSVCGGLVTGVIGVVVAGALNQGGETLAGAFVVGFLIGVVLCSTLSNLVSSATNAVIVCFAEAPLEFNQNHPELSQQMLSAWRMVFPNEFSY